MTKFCVALFAMTLTTMNTWADESTNLFFLSHVKIVEVLPDGSEISILNSSPNLELRAKISSTANPIFSNCYISAELGTGGSDYPRSIVPEILLDDSGIGRIDVLKDRCESKLNQLNFWKLFPAGSKGGEGHRLTIDIRESGETRHGVTNVVDIVCKKSAEYCSHSEISMPISGAMTKIRIMLID